MSPAPILQWQSKGMGDCVVTEALRWGGYSGGHQAGAGAGLHPFPADSPTPGHTRSAPQTKSLLSGICHTAHLAWPQRLLQAGKNLGARTGPSRVPAASAPNKPQSQHKQPHASRTCQPRVIP